MSTFVRITSFLHTEKNLEMEYLNFSPYKISAYSTALRATYCTPIEHFSGYEEMVRCLTSQVRWCYYIQCISPPERRNVEPSYII